MISLFIPWKEVSFITSYFLNWAVKENNSLKFLYLVLILFCLPVVLGKVILIFNLKNIHMYSCFSVMP